MLPPPLSSSPASEPVISVQQQSHCCCLSCRPAVVASTSTAAFPEKQQDGNDLWNHGQSNLEKSEASTSPASWAYGDTALLLHIILCYSRTWCHGSGLHAPIFLPCRFGRDPTSRDCFSDRLKAGGTACIQRVTEQGRASFLPQELLWHIPMPCVLLPSCQSPASRNDCRRNAPLTLCVSGHKISCRLLNTQRCCKQTREVWGFLTAEVASALCNGAQQMCC